MESSSEPMKIGFYLDILSRRRWYVIVPFCVVMIIGIYKATAYPVVYRAETLVLIQPRKDPEAYVRSVVSAEIKSRINTISQQIMSRTNLEKIINQFNLFSEPDQADMSMEDKVGGLRQRISVEVIGDDRLQSADAFSISFTGSDPDKVMHITNALAANFIGENTKIREEKAIGTSDFFEEQLEKKRKQLEDTEQQLKIFRAKHMGGLPEQLQTNLRILDQLQRQLNEKQDNLRDAKKNLINLEKELSETQSIQKTVTGYSFSGLDDVEANPYLKLQNMKQELQDLSSRYTERHPDVIRLKQQIKDLEQEIETGAAEANTASKGNLWEQSMHPILAERRALLLQQRDETRLEIKELKIENTNLLNQIAYYEKLVDDTPKNEQELLALNRDYENMEKSYNALLERKIQAQLAVDLEKKKKGEQFQILDPARYPNRPSVPDLKILFVFTLMAATGLGGGLAFVREYFDTSIRQTKDLESDLNIPVLASIPKIYKAKDKAIYRINNVLTFVSVVFGFALCAGFAALVLNGVEPTMELVQRFIKL